jgi:hypothetical protein
MLQKKIQELLARALAVKRLLKRLAEHLVHLAVNLNVKAQGPPMDDIAFMVTGRRIPNSLTVHC